MIKKEVFQVFTDNGIYLPEYQLGLVCDIIKSEGKNRSVLSLLDELVSSDAYKKYNNPAKGAYVIDINTYHKDVRKEVEQIDPVDGVVVRVWPSLYAAGKHFSGNKKKNAAGNIAKTIKGKTKTAYGWSWRFKKKE